MLDIFFYLNGMPQTYKIGETWTTLKFLREELKLTGSREGCNEGDCGACTVLWGREINGEIKYQAVNSCLLPAVRLQNTHIVTIEGLKKDFELHPIQQAFLDHNGAQCGFCTPGFIISIFALLLDYPNFTDEQLKNYLEGNLCRCTGYDAIFKAVKSLSGISKEKLLPAYFSVVDHELLTKKTANESEKYFRPQNLASALKILAENPEISILAGNTDLQPPANFYRRESKMILDLIDLAELNQVVVQDDCLKIGAGVSLKDCADHSLVLQHLPVLSQSINLMASNQIRSTATIAGNIVNASPVADTVPVLLAADAELLLACTSGQRVVRLADFYHGYKKTERRKDEILVEIIIPVKSAKMSFAKASKRKSVDISSLSSACSLVVNENKIMSVKIGVGGGGPIPLLLNKTADFLIGKEISELTAKQASDIAIAEISPISDVRGSDEFRKTLLANHLLLHLGITNSLINE